MIKRMSLILTLCISLYGAVLSQVNTSKENCLYPFSYKFDAFSVKNREDTENRAQAFREKLETESKDARGYIFVYGSRTGSVREIDRLMAQTEGFLGITLENRAMSKFSIRNGGYRNDAEMEFYIKPFKCTDEPSAKSDYDFREVVFVEAPLDETLEKSGNELLSMALEKPNAKCPAAAVAVGLCLPEKTIQAEVYIIVDTTGKVIFSKAVSGHPLLRISAAGGVREWKFKPLVIDGKQFNMKGTVTVGFEPSGKQTVEY